IDVVSARPGNHLESVVERELTAPQRAPHPPHVRPGAKGAERQSPRLAGLLQSPLTDSNRRPPSYHDFRGWSGEASSSDLRLRSVILVAGYLRWTSLGFDRSAPQLLHDLLSVLKMVKLVS